MRRILTPLLCLFLAATAPAAVTITGPTDPVPVDRYVVLPISGAEATPQVFVWPKTATALVDISVGQPHVVFRAEQEGTYELTVIASRARVIPDDAYDRCLILVGDEVEPKPDPDPKPDPKPDPDPQPTPVNTLRVQIVWEKRDGPPLPIDQVLLFNSQKIERWIDENGHDLERLDVDAERKDGRPAVSPVPESLPVVRLYDDESGKLLWEGLPKTETEFLDTLKEHCKTCQRQSKPRPQPSVGRGFLRRRR